MQCSVGIFAGQARKFPAAPCRLVSPRVRQPETCPSRSSMHAVRRDRLSHVAHCTRAPPSSNCARTMDQDQRKEHPADVADQLERLSVEEAQAELRDLPAKEGAAVLAEFEEDTRPALLENLAPGEIANLLQELPHNEAADIISALPEEVQPEVLDKLSAADRKQVSEMLSYPPESAG